jgi:hypothetical protein
MIESDYLFAAVAGLVVIGNLLVIGGVVFTVSRSKAVVSDDCVSEVAGLRRELQAISGAMASFSELLDRFYDTTERGRQSDRPPAMHEDKGGKALEVAARLAGTGVSVDEIVNLCGVSEGEAQLIRVLNEDQEKRVAVG